MFSRLLRPFRSDNRKQGETKPRQKKSSLLSCFRTRRKKWSLERPQPSQKASYRPSHTHDQEERRMRLEKMKIDLQNMKNERDELREILSQSTTKDLNVRNNFESEMLMMQHQQVMTDLQRMPDRVSEAFTKCKHLIDENKYYWYCALLSESIQVKHKAKRAWNENRELLREQIALEESIKETRRLCAEANMKISVAISKQHQDKDKLKERLQDPPKQEELAHEQKDLAEKMQDHFDVSEMRSEILQQKLEQCRPEQELPQTVLSPRSTQCAKKVSNSCISVLIVMALLGCIFFLYFGFVCGKGLYFV